MDVLGPSPKAMRHRKYLFEMVDYFTKWIEVEAIATITTAKVRRIIWRTSSLALVSLVPSSLITVGS